jgi:hypothetical protein
MRGIELSEGFFRELVRPAIEREFPQVIDGVSAAIIGDGSEVLGFDDESSRDHNFSPRVTLFLEDSLCARSGDGLVGKLRSSLPDEYRGVKLLWEEHRSAVRVLPLPGWFLEHLGRPALPATAQDWLRCDEQRLVELTSGKVFADPNGRLGKTRQQLEFFPDGVRLFLLRLCLVRMSECAGAERAVRREDPVALAWYAGYFGYFAIRAGHLLARRYCPYHKWMARSLLSLGEPGRELHGLVARLLGEREPGACRDGFLAVLGHLGDRIAKGLGVPAPKMTDPDGGVFLPFDWQAVMRPLSERLPEELKSLSPLVSPPGYLGHVFDFTGYDAGYEDLLAANLGFLRG